MASDVPMPESMTEEAMANWLDDNDTDGERSVASYGTLARSVLALVEAERAKERAALSRPAADAEAVREACLERLRVLMCAWTANAVDPHAETYKAMAAESILREFAPRALPLPASDEVERARRAFYEAARYAVQVRRDHGPDHPQGMNATWEVSRKYDALLAAERAAKGGDHG